MNKVSKILVTVLCFLMILAISVSVFATVGNHNVDPTDTNELDEMGNKIVGVIRVIGIFISVGALMVLGIKYMMGSAEEKAEYKKTLIPYAIGAVLLFGASFFANTLYDWIK